MFSQNEQNVLQLIEQNPFQSQQEIANTLGLTRSTVASIISSLVAKRQLLGRAYIVNTQPTVFCIGGMNIDRKFRLLSSLQLQTSNPVDSELSVGGVARNVAENLGRLGVSVQLLSVAGCDQDYEWVKQQTQTFVDMSQVTQCVDVATSTYSAILDDAGEMQLALADMAICDRMDIAWIQSFNSRLIQAGYLVADLNLPKETVAYLVEFARQHAIPLAIIPVSAPKMLHLPRDLEGVTWLIVNLDESEAYFDVTVSDEVSIENLLAKWLATGVEHVVMTRGSKSSLYGNQQGDKAWIHPAVAKEVSDVTGAGDSFSAGLIYGQLMAQSALVSIEYGITNAYYTVQSPKTVRLNLTASRLVTEHKELKERGVLG